MRARGKVGERWLIRGLGWRVIVSIGSDEHGRLYGVRARRPPYPDGYYPLTPVSSHPGNWGRFVRSRSLVRRDRRKRYPDTPARFERDGYVFLRIQAGGVRVVAEHRYVMEQAVGRLLKHTEHVHHINLDRKDNRLENLLLLSAKEHQQLHGELHRKARERQTDTKVST